MSLTLVPVTPENRAAAENLSLLPSQLGFVESVSECLAEADRIPLWQPMGIYHDDALIGFAMFGLWPKEGTRGRLWFDRFLIDRRFQHHGYGRRAVTLILTEMRRQYPGREIYLSVYPDNPTAIALYRSFGFAFNGELDEHGEHIMVLPAQTKLP